MTLKINERNILIIDADPPIEEDDYWRWEQDEEIVEEVVKAKPSISAMFVPREELTEEDGILFA